MRSAIVGAALLLAAGTGSAEEGFAGDWALRLPSGEAGWLALRQEAGAWQGGLLWAVGSERPLLEPTMEAGRLQFWRKGKSPGAGAQSPTQRWRVSAEVEGDAMRLESEGEVFEGKRMPPLPTRPDLSKVEFGEPLRLFNGRDLEGWRVTDPAKRNGWSARDGVLHNATPKTDFSAYGEHANLRTEAEFTDFELSVAFRLPAGVGGNSGIYLRGLYEVQVTHRDSPMQGIHGPGAVFGRVAPTQNAGKAAGEWEHYRITLVDRHVTVVHNGVRVIDNAPVVGPTGGALNADVTRPGPLMLQGDHTQVEFRELWLRPRK